MHENKQMTVSLEKLERVKKGSKRRRKGKLERTVRV
jgi:hypothetical protein